MLVRLGSHLCFVVAGAIVAAFACAQPVAAFEAASPRELRPQTIDTGLFWVKRTAFSHDGRLVAFLGYAAPNSLQTLEVTVFDVGSHRLVKSLPVPNSSGVVILKGGIAFSPDDARLAAGANEIAIWDTRTWMEAARAPGPFADGAFGADDLLGLAYTPDGQRIVTAYGKVWGPGEVHVRTRDQFVGLYDAARLAYRNGQAPENYQRPEVEVLDASTGAPLRRLAIVRDGQRGDRSLITSGLAVSQDGRAAYVAVQDWEGLVVAPPAHATPRIAVERVDLESGHVSSVFERRQEDGFSALAVNADQSLVATGEADGNKQSWRAADGTWVNHETADPVRIWSTEDGAPRAELDLSGGAVRQLLFLPEGTGVVTCQTDNRSHNLMTVWDTTTKSPAAVVHVDTPRPAVVSCAISSDGRQAVLTIPTGEAFGVLAHDTAYLTEVTVVHK